MAAIAGWSCAGIYRLFQPRGMPIGQTTMEHEPSNRRLLMGLLLGGLVAWGCFLGLGAYLGLDPQTPDRDWRRVLVVVATSGGFLLFWLAALAFRRRR
jgi:hypothetical protein